jgi:thiol-disulfide isomerase/thioredoxin
VVHVTSADKSHQQNKDFHSDSTYWIDKTALVFRKKVEHSDTFIIVTPSVHVPFHMDSTTVYPVADFNPRTTAADFSFTPPPDAKEVATLEPEYTGHAVQHPEAEMVGQPAPALTLVADDAGKVELSSFRGKPLLLEFWATWCGPCLAAMPAFNRLYAELREKGVSVVTIDQDAVPADATAYLARHGYAWPNYHDTDKQIGKAYKAFKGVGGIPTVVLMDAQGKIAYEETGMDEPALRKAIAALGPEYASVAPRDAEKPAPAAKANEH